MYKKLIFILLLSTILITSCRSKKKISCPSFDIEKPNTKIENKNSIYKIVILKDGKRINNKTSFVISVLIDGFDNKWVSTSNSVIVYNTVGVEFKNNITDNNIFLVIK